MSAAAASTSTIDLLVQVQFQLAAQVLDRPRQLAGVALRDERVGEGRVEHHDQPLVVRHRRARTRRGLHLDLVGRQGHPAERDAAVGMELELAGPRRRHDGRDGRAEPLADDRQQGPHAPGQEVRVGPDEAHVVDVQLVGEHLQQGRLVGRVEAGGKGPAGQGKPGRGQRLAHAEAGLGAQGPRQVDRPAQRDHGRRQGAIGRRRGWRRRPVREVDGRRHGLVMLGDEHLVQLLGQERQQRRGDPGGRDQRLVQGPEGRRAIGRAGVAGEASPAAPEVPRGEVVDVLAKAHRRGASVVRLQRRAHLERQVIAAKGDPPVEHVAPRAAGKGQATSAGARRLPAGQAGVAHQEGEHVPQHQ